MINHFEIIFDLNLRCRNEDLHLEDGADGQNFIDQNLVVLEVKVNNSVPLRLTRILHALKCDQWSTYAIRSKNIANDKDLLDRIRAKCQFKSIDRLYGRQRLKNRKDYHLSFIDKFNTTP